MNRVDEQSWKLRVDTRGTTGPRPHAGPAAEEETRSYVCDRCGHEMFELNCKVICPNCGSRFDCSDLNIYFDQPGS
jgi:Zn finger protein HypA/HybF involved in hydrogenase expression